MKRKLVIALALAVALAAVGVGLAGRSSPSAGADEVDPLSKVTPVGLDPLSTVTPGVGVYTYEEALALGIPSALDGKKVVEAALSGAPGALPLCEPDPSWKGYASPEEAAAAAAAAPEEPVCIADPRKTLYGVNAPVP